MEKSFYILSNLGGNIPHLVCTIAASNGKNALKKYLNASCLLKSAYTFKKQHDYWTMATSNNGSVYVAQEVY